MSEYTFGHGGCAYEFDGSKFRVEAPSPGALQAVLANVIPGGVALGDRVYVPDNGPGRPVLPPDIEVWDGRKFRAMYVPDPAKPDGDRTAKITPMGRKWNPEKGEWEIRCDVETERHKPPPDGEDILSLNCGDLIKVGHNLWKIDTISDRGNGRGEIALVSP